MSSHRPPGRPNIPTRPVSRTLGAHYLKKASEHLANAQSALADGEWNTAVLLSVHAGISAGDAVCVSRFGIRCASPTHMDQVRLIRKSFSQDEAAEKAASQLAALIDRKNAVEYEARLCRSDDAERATRQAERVVAWAQRICEARQA